MRKLSLLAVAAVVGLVGCTDPETKWLYSGSSVGLDREGWISASPERQLGTAGNWLKSLQDKGWLNDPAITAENAELKKNAQSLTDCLNTSIEYSQDETNYLVAECVKVLGWAANK
ncbi:hypothetical protein [Vibrio parahaemolyticus]|uniref:hypothetical protein n=1 Tax=Vibrio parahaemolyticus TaxID=670 RepID=UPI00387B6658